jgi:exodeoxyribonuclease III
MKMISWNVNGIRASVGKGFIDVVENFNADIFCIQETKAQDDQVDTALKGLPDHHIYRNSAEKKGYSGVAVLSKNEALNVIYDIGVPEHDTEGRVLTLEFESFFLVNVYVPNSGSELKRLHYRATWDVAFSKFIAELKRTKPIIVTGDFNVAHEAIDLARPKPNYNKTSGYTQKEIDGLDGILNTGIVDTFRMKHPEEIKYTFWSMRFNARANNTGWRIDYFLLSKEYMPKVKNAEIYNDVMGSDHCPIGLEIDLD